MLALRNLHFAADVPLDEVGWDASPSLPWLAASNLQSQCGLHLLAQALHLKLEYDRLKESYV
jgi:hypothetical protein